MPELDVEHLSKKYFEIRWTPGNVTASKAGHNIGICEEEFEKHENCEETGADILEALEENRNPSKTPGGNFFTRWGTFYEETSLLLFIAVTGLLVKKSKFWQHDIYKWLYATPDGLVGDDFILEVKNPWNNVHEYIPLSYLAQMMIQSACSGKKNIYFMSQCIKKNIARIWKVKYSEEFYEWMMKQLIYWHEIAKTPGAKLDLTKFDRNPPEVEYEIIHEIESISDLVEVPKYDERFSEEACLWGSTPITWKEWYERDQEETTLSLNDIPLKINNFKRKTKEYKESIINKMRQSQKKIKKN